MAISFKKEVILEAIQAVLAENKAYDVEATDGTKVTKSFASDAEANDFKAKNTNIKNVKALEEDSVEEDHHENPNDDSDMAKSQLYAIAKYALELLQMIKDGDPLDAWVQAKITKASDYIDAVQHYLEGEEYLDANYGHSEEDLEEARRGQGTIQNDLDNVKAKMKELAKQYSAGDKSVLAQLKDLNDEKKALEKELIYVVSKIGAGQEYKGEVDETLAEGVSCCGRCGRVHESAQECKKPYISKDSPNHCSNKK